MLYLVGNGPSRKDFDLNQLDQWWGMNMIYRDYQPELVFIHDIAPQNEMVKDKYYKNHKVCTGEWNELPMEMWEVMQYGLPGKEIIQTRAPDDDRFVVQGEGPIGKDRTYMVGYTIAHSNNIVIYKNDLLRNLFCGMYALAYAVHHGHKQICLFGYDALQYDELQNIYGPEDCDTYHEVYTEVQGVGTVQKAQFVALLEHINTDYPDVEIFFKNSIDGFDKVEYNDILSRYNIEDKWILDKGCLESEI